MKQSSAPYVENAGSVPGADRSAQERGFTVLDRNHPTYPFYGRIYGEDEMGNTYEGDNPRERGGFLTRPQGEER